MYPVNLLRSLKGEQISKAPSSLPERLSLHSPLLLPFGSQFSFVQENNQKYLQEYVRELWEKSSGIKVLWLYSPLSVHLVGKCGEDMVVYDRMDDLTRFKGGDDRMAEAEEALIQKADIVFAGGKSLYESVLTKRDKAAPTYCFPSGVDVKHFSIAQHVDCVQDAEVSAIPSPRIGYFGAIDERLNYPLLAQLAEQNKALHFILVGPVVKIKPESLPQAENIHYVAAKEYEKLPSVISCFDIGMMPFALNDATRQISPTKTLEYFAAACPVVSTPLPDLVHQLSDYLFLAETAEEFSAAFQKLLAQPKEEKEKELQYAREYAKKQSWDERVKQMEKMMRDVAKNHGRN